MSYFMHVTRATAVFAAAISFAHAQDYDQGNAMLEMQLQMARVSGSLFAAAELCGDHNSAQLDRLKSQQEAQWKAMGLDLDESRRAFESSRQRSVAKLKAVSREERDAACAELRTMGPVGGSR